MARGDCFCVARNRADAMDTKLGEADLYEYLGELGVDYVEDEAEPEEQIDRFMNWLRNYGAEVGADTDEDGHCLYCFSLTDGVKEEIFRERFQLLTKKVNDLTLSEFSCGGGAVWAIRETVEDTCGDYVCDEMLCCPVNMDTFIRYAETNVKYYVSPCVVLIH